MDNRYLRRAKAEGVKGYLHKPFSAMALKHAVCEVNGSNRSPDRVVAFVTPEKRGASR
jgi:DNA-binding NarL/FixJ family response regulator